MGVVISCTYKWKQMEIVCVFSVRTVGETWRESIHSCSWTHYREHDSPPCAFARFNCYFSNFRLNWRHILMVHRTKFDLHFKVLSYFLDDFDIFENESIFSKHFFQFTPHLICFDLDSLFLIRLWWESWENTNKKLLIKSKIRNNHIKRPFETYSGKFHRNVLMHF